MKKNVSIKKRIKFSKLRSGLISMALAGIILLSGYSSGAQCQPYISIDGNLVLANQTVAAGLPLPIWLKSGQTLAANEMINSISVIEFNITNGNTLEFSQVLAVTTVQTVPEGKVWKVESISKKATLSSSYGATYSSPGTYNFTVPQCAQYICIEVWGPGGDGQQNKGGGGGGYGQECFAVSPGASYTVTVGAGGSGGTTGVGSLISATGGLNGPTGTGGTSTAAANVSGGSGSSTRGGSSGCGPNCVGGTGGAAGVSTSCSSGVGGGSGVAPGGGGGSGWYNCNNGSYNSPGVGADGKVIITW